MVLSKKRIRGFTSRVRGHYVEELIDAIVHEYLVYIEPLVYLIEKAEDSVESGAELSKSDMEDLYEEASSSSFNIFPLHALLSSVKKSDMGKSDTPSSRFVHQVINENVLVLLKDNMAKAAARLIKECSSGNGSRKDISAAVKRASHAVCIELKRIKDLNRGFLPDADLKELWDRFSCGDAFAELDLG